jgi:hypothetical protein
MPTARNPVRPLRILFMIKHFGATRNFHLAIRELASRGHIIHLAFESYDRTEWRRPMGRLSEGLPGITAGKSPGGDEWQMLARQIRRSIDYLRYLEPEYADAPALRARARDKAPAGFRRLTDRRLVRRPAALRLLNRVLRSVERALPPPAAVDEYISAFKPDVLLVTPLVGLGSFQANYVRSAKRLGIPTGFCALSWDNLTNKGLIRDIPDSVVVWNEAQAGEARDLQGVPEQRIAITGATAYDHWFGWEPSRSRDGFCARVRLRPDRPLLLYVCSSRFIAVNEVDHVRAWVKAVREHGGEHLREAGIIVRPHPQHWPQWEDVTFDDDPQVSIHPRGGDDPMNDHARNDYFNSIYYSTAVVGVNTSALIESAIVGRPVYTILVPEFAGTQEGTLHFHHLHGEAGGLLTVAHSFPDHVRQLNDADATDPDFVERNRRFLESFVRPFGLDQPATPLLCDAVERLDELTPVPERETTGQKILRTALWPLARLAHKLGRRRKFARRAKAREAAARARTKPKPASDWTTARTSAQSIVDVARRHRHRRRRAREAKEAANGGTSRPPATVTSAKERLQQLVDSGKPVVAGPWFSEVGYELLYWLPFLTWALDRHPELRDRVTFVSRGGNASWYEQLRGRYADLYAHHGPQDIRKLAEHTAMVESGGYRKQMAVSSEDVRLVEGIASGQEGSDFELLHPSVMYAVYRQLSKLRAVHHFDQLFTYRPMEAPLCDANVATRLPDDYVAVRFYFRSSFPDNHENRRFANQMLRRLTETSPVVLLNTGMQFDDHDDFAPPRSERLIRLDDLMTPTNNLAVQTAVMAGARSFFGTYGGLSYLAPFLGVPSVALFSEPSFRALHHELVEHALSDERFGRLTLVDCRSADLDSLLGLTAADSAA